jgi:hypothetical protein
VVIEALKSCLDCQDSKPLELFHRKGIYRDSRCKPCALAHKKNKYITKKRRKMNCYNNIVIKTISTEMDIKSDLLSLLESFLLEECIHE